jgi:hypothetical protein
VVEARMQKARLTADIDADDMNMIIDGGETV